VIAFLDASAIIYFIEGRKPFATRVQACLVRLAKRNAHLGIAVSRLSWLECRVGPMRSQAERVLEDYDAFFRRPDLVWVELSAEVVELATMIRAYHGLKTPDALQAASCLQLGMGHVLLTGDNAFRRVAGLNLELLR
jgi:predicted nucleic acid-binding protein